MAEDSVPPLPWKEKRSGLRARKSEEQGAKAEGGRRVPASGALRRHRSKGDIRAAGFLVEDKFTDADSYRLTKTDLRKIEMGALQQQALPSMRINISGTRVRVVREEDFLYLVANQR